MTAQEFPKKSSAREDVLARMQQLRSGDADWKNGRTWSLVYHGGDELTQMLKDAYCLFFAENGLSPLAFPSLQKMEAEVLDIAAGLFHAPDGKGSLTSGGNESILVATKAARQWARAEKPQVTTPEMIVPASVHPAFEKASLYLDVKAVHAPVGPDFKVDLDAVRSLVTPNTIMVVGSAPGYPQGVIDDIPALGEIAETHGLWLHVDACLGGWLLPWAEKLGHPLPPWDFRVPQVRSLSADLHKYGFAAKGASVVMYRDKDLRRHQFFAYSGWSGGMYASPSATGTRPGGAIAAAWAVLQFLGEEGYLRLSSGILATAKRLEEGVAATPGLRILGSPAMSVFSFTSDTLNIYELGDAMTARGWALDRQQFPPALHMMVTPAHTPVVDRFLADLTESAAALGRGEPAPEGSAAMYGMIGAIADQGAVDSFLVDFMDNVYQPDLP